MTDKKKPRQTIHVAATGKFRTMLEEIANEEGISMAEVIRSVVKEYYFETFRKRKFGYQAGMTTGNARVAKRGIQERVDAVDQMSETELIDYLFELEFINHEEEETNDYKWAAVKSQISNQVMIQQVYGSGSRRDVWSLPELKNELLKHLKGQKKKVE